jgi:micrococcal nuclease
MVRMYEYKAVVEDAIDGDTIDVKVDLGFSIFKKARLRLNGIDTPETSRCSKKQERAGELVSKFVEDILFDNKLVYITTHKKGSFGRYLADVYIPNLDKSFNQFLYDEGYAIKYGRHTEWKGKKLNKIIEELSYLEDKEE